MPVPTLLFDTGNTNHSVGTTVTGTCGSAVPAGQAVVLFYTYSNDNGAVTLTASDSKSNTIGTKKLDVADTSVSGDQRFAIFVYVPTTALTTSDTISVVQSGTDFLELQAYTIPGLTSTPYLDAQGSWQQSVNGGTANTLTTGNLAMGSGNVFVLAGSMNSLDGGAAPNYPTVGTGLTFGGNWFLDADFTPSRDLATWGYGNLTAPGTAPIHFTAATSSSGDNYVTFAVALAVASSGATLAGAASDAVSAAGALSTSIRLAGTPSDATSATGALTAGGGTLVSAGASSKGVTAFTGTSTTTAVTTAAAGSTFYVAVIQANTTPVGVTVTDNKGNTYSPIGTAVNSGGNASITRYQCVNGTGGSGHTVTATLASGTSSVTVFLQEILNGALITPLDQSAVNAAGFASPPVSSGSITLAPPASGELAISVFTTTRFVNPITFTEANGFTIQQSNTSGTSGPPAASMGTKVVTSSGSVNASWTDGTGGQDYAALIDSFKGGAGAVGAALAGAATDATSATGALVSPAAALAGSASDVVSAAGALFTAIRLAAGATDSTSAVGGLTTGILLGSAATDTTSATAFLTNWASVTLTSPLYTGFGGVLDPVIPWARSPVVGSTLYYDATYITIATNGVISSTANNISALVQFNDGSGWQDRIITITPYLVGYASTLTSATGSLSSAAQLAGAATDLTTAAASLSTQIKMAGSASDTTSATAALTAGAGLNGAATDLTSAVGALTTAIRLASAAIDTTVASATLNGTAAPLAGSASDSISATGILSTQIRLAAAAVDVITAFGALSTHIVLAATALDAISATGALSGSTAPLAGTANDTTSASALLTTRIALLGAAGDTISAAGNLVTHIMMLGAATDTTSATGNLIITTPVQFGRATVVALSQTGFQAARTAYQEGSACFILAGYFGPSRAPFTPQAVQYRMDDITSGLNLVPWTSLTPAATNQVTISSTLNEMVSLTRPWECRQVVFQITDWFGDTNYARVAYDLIRVPGEMSS